MTDVVKLINWSTHREEHGFVAFFDAVLACGVTVRGLSLLRRRESEDAAWLVFPLMERRKAQAVGLSKELRQAIGERATAMYSAATGVTLTYAAPIRGGVDVESDDAVEPQDAGLRRFVREDVEDALRIAGI